MEKINLGITNGISGWGHLLVLLLLHAAISTYLSGYNSPVTISTNAEIFCKPKRISFRCANKAKCNSQLCLYRLSSLCSSSTSCSTKYVLGTYPLSSNSFIRFINFSYISFD